MCIRDRPSLGAAAHEPGGDVATRDGADLRDLEDLAHLGGACLLYTSDAADERSSVDLGGRRILKKKIKKQKKKKKKK